MNNSFLPSEEETLVGLPRLRAREVELVRIIEALRAVEQSTEWSTLKELLFDNVLSGLEKSIKAESHKSPLNTEKIYGLQGEIRWARRYANLAELSSLFSLELTNVRRQLTLPAARDMAQGQ